MTLTISLPKAWKRFFDQLHEDGYNRSQLLLKMVRILCHLERIQKEFPGGLPRLIDALSNFVESGGFTRILNQEKPAGEEPPDAV